MKTLLLSHKRNPEEKLDKILDNKNSEDKAIEDKKEENKEEGKKEQEPKNENGLELDENKEKENTEETNKEKKNKKRIKKSLKRNNNKTKEEKNQENENKEKEEINNSKQKQTNKRIGDYFLLSGKKEANNGNNSEENKELNNTENNNINNPEENTIKEITQKDPIKEINNAINKDEFFSFSNDANDKIKYDPSYLTQIQDVPVKVKDFYNLTSNEINTINPSDYISKLKNYFSEINTMNNVNQFNEINYKKNKLIFIHNSFAPLKKIPNRESNLINPRNYLAKDEYLIDYEKDSEDEFMEENAEDIKSNDNEDKEEDEEDDINSIQDDKFIVPDGHLSEEELSDKDIMKERQLLENSKEHLLGIMNILNIRRNFNKPILIDFRNKKNDDNVNLLMSQLTIGLFKYEDENANNENINISNTNNQEENNNINEKNENKGNKIPLSFPIVIGSKVTKYKGIQDSIKIHFEDILRKVHGSYDTKEHLILQLNKKFEDISKKALNTFFKEKCFKIQKKYWMVNNDTLSQFNIKNEDLEQIKKDNFNIYKEKEEKRKKELEEIKIKDGIIQPPQNQEEPKEENNDESNNSNNNINSNNNGDKNEKEINGNNNDNNIKSKSKSKSKNGIIKDKGKSKNRSKKRHEANNEGYGKTLEVLFKESAEAQKNNKNENKINDNQNDQSNKNQKENDLNNQSNKKETFKIFESIKMTQSERQKDLLEIQVVN